MSQEASGPCLAQFQVSLGQGVAPVKHFSKKKYTIQETQAIQSEIPFAFFVFRCNKVPLFLNEKLGCIVWRAKYFQLRRIRILESKV